MASLDGCPLSPEALLYNATTESRTPPDHTPIGLEGGLRHNGQDRSSNLPRFPLVVFSDIRIATGPRYLVKGLIPRVGLTVVWGGRRLD